jgi:hypothetical protein
MHRLWTTCREHNDLDALEKASDEEIIAALFDYDEPFPDPWLFGYLRKYRMPAILKYQELFYTR